MVDEKFKERMISAGYTVGKDSISMIIPWIQK